MAARIGAAGLAPDLAAPEQVINSRLARLEFAGHKQGGSVGRHAIDRFAPSIAELYRSAALLRWLGQLSGAQLQVSPDHDSHAYAQNPCRRIGAF